MKELSIEEKAQRYDEIIERAKMWYYAPNSDKIPTYANRIVSDIFPELKESEDERIRKELIAHFKTNSVSESWSGLNVKKVIAWLEKQGEQKPADKIEPKFKVGDWIVDNNVKTPFQITGIANEKYDIISIYGNDMVFSFHEVEHFYHLWTFQDAKASDVLATEPIEGNHSPFVAIYKKQNEEDFDSYCFIGFDGKFYEGQNGHSTEEVHPATKEQRDLLFQKMKEAGYKWNAEKKELIKIEQKPAWSEEDETIVNKILSVFDEFKEAFHGCKIGSPIDIEDLDKIGSWLKSLKERVQPQPRQEWKQENTGDLTDFENAMMHIGGSFFGQYAGLDPNDTNAIKEQAKLLLELVPSKEWSEEDGETLDGVIDSLRRYKYNVPSRAVDEQILWLKSLKPQTIWKPSISQLNALSIVSKGSAPDDIEAIVSLYNDLKKLREE